MLELADRADSNSAVREDVWVQVPLAAPHQGGAEPHLNASIPILGIDLGPRLLSTASPSHLSRDALVKLTTMSRMNSEAHNTTDHRQTVAGLLEAARARLDRLDPAAAAAAIDDGAVIIDTRCADLRRETGVIPGSVHAPLSVLYWRLDPTSGYNDPAISDPERQIILVCAHGYSSNLAAATLRDLGFLRATDINGGFQAWAAAGLPVELLPD